MAQRLEDVRARSGFPSLRSFWIHLADGWTKEDGWVSYEAVRNYHYDRDPPGAYVARVVEVFSDYCTAQWLLTGKGPVTPADAVLATEERGELGIALRWQLDFLGNLPLAVSAALVNYGTLRHAARWRDPEGAILADHDDARDAWDIVLSAFPEGRQPLSGAAFANYALAMISALNFALDVPTIPKEETDV
jgi:hypothetical protein